MTRDEAINVLENVRINAGYYFHADAKDNYECALRMAIEALSADVVPKEIADEAYAHGYTEAESKYRAILERKHGSDGIPVSI